MPNVSSRLGQGPCSPWHYFLQVTGLFICRLRAVFAEMWSESSWLLLAQKLVTCCFRCIPLVNTAAGSEGRKPDLTFPWGRMGRISGYLHLAAALKKKTIRRLMETHCTFQKCKVLCPCRQEEEGKDPLKDKHSIQRAPPLWVSRSQKI